MHEPPPPPIQTPLQDHGTAPTVQRQNAAIVLLLVILILLAAAVGVGSVITVRLFTATSPYDEFEADMKEVGKKIQNETAERFRRAAWN